MAYSLMDDSNTLGAIVASLIFVLAVVVLFLWNRSRSGGKNTVLVLGLSNSGKTVMFARLINGRRVQTVMSQQENVCERDVDGTRLVDVPGAVNVRTQSLARYLAHTSAIKGVLYVLDASTVSKQVRDVAELLYDVCKQLPQSTKLCMACNKHDLPTAKTPQTIEKLLTQEMVLLVGSRVAALQSTDGEGDSGDKRWQTAFEWPKHTQWVTCNSIHHDDDSKEYDLSGVEEWMEQL